MKGHQKIWLRASTWVFAEVILTLLGLDNLADYSEFLYEQDRLMAMARPQVYCCRLRS